MSGNCIKFASTLKLSILGCKCTSDSRQRCTSKIRQHCTTFRVCANEIGSIQMSRQKVVVQ